VILLVDVGRADGAFKGAEETSDFVLSGAGVSGDGGWFTGWLEICLITLARSCADASDANANKNAQTDRYGIFLKFFKIYYS
jgi:hypothetical protein